MSFSRRTLFKGAGASLLASALGCGSKTKPPEPQPGSAATGGTAGTGLAKPGVTPHYLVIVTLRGGFDNIMSVTPQDQTKVGDKIYCGYRADERIAGSKRLFGPLIGGLVRHDADLALIHGVRCDTTNHPDGLAMLTRGSRASRSGEIAAALAGLLPGTAPMPNLDLATLDGQVVLHERERPKWADVRAKAQQAQIAALGANEQQTKLLTGAMTTAANLERFLDDARRDETALAGKFASPLAVHFRLAYQAIRGNWAKCIHVASRLLSFDSHSDNVRFQQRLVPPTFGDLATFVDLLKATPSPAGTLYDQTTIVAFSELGRFPRLNGQGGKDHWPENSWIMIGKGVKKGVTVGGIDDSGKGLAVDFRTGAPAANGARPLYIDNGFATLVRIAGGDPVKANYPKDSVIDALVA